VGNNPLNATDPSGQQSHVTRETPHGAPIRTAEEREAAELGEGPAPDMWVMHHNGDGEAALVPYFLQDRLERSASGDYEWVAYAVPGVDPEIAAQLGRLTPVLMGPTSGSSFGFSGTSAVTQRAGSTAAVQRIRALHTLGPEVRSTMTVAGHEAQRLYITAGSIRHAVCYGSRHADPQGTPGAFMYEIQASMNTVSRVRGAREAGTASLRQGTFEGRNRCTGKGFACDVPTSGSMRY
jgi:hypothetical protein